MKSLAWLLLLAAVPACGGSAAGTEEEAAGEHASSNSATVQLDHATQERIALRCEPAAALKQPPEIPAFGMLLDPLDAARLSSDADVAAIECAATRDEAQRLGTLHDEGGNVSLRAVQERQAQLAGAEGRLRLANAELQRATGAAFAARPAAERQAVLDAMLRGELGLARVRPSTAPPAQALVGARVALVERPDEALAVDHFELSLAPDPSATPAWLVWVRAAGTPLRAGSPVDARMVLDGGARDGVAIPRSAVLRDGEGAWVFVQTGEESFERRRVTLDTPLPGGWFATTGASPGEPLVVQGAELLLSEQLRSTIEGD